MLIKNFVFYISLFAEDIPKDVSASLRDIFNFSFCIIFMFNILKKKNKDEIEVKDEQEITAQSAEQQLAEEEVKINKDIVVHTMPERFRSSYVKASKTKKTGLFIIIGGIIFLMVIIGGLYYYLFVIQPRESSQIPEDSSTPAKVETEKTSQPTQPAEPKPVKPEIKATSIKSAKAAYMDMRAEFDKINTFNDYEQVIRKYGSEKKLLELTKQKRKYNSLSGSAKADFVAALTQFAPNLAEIKDIDERVKDNIATLYITIKGLEEKATITMALEINEWKLESEIWPEMTKADDSSGAASTADFVMATDSDNDGLADKEEILLGCDAGNMDSDGDGYNDLSEVMNLYNPAGANKLINNPNISKYLNNSFNYNLLYPADWSFSAIGGDDSVMFRSSDNQFIQVIGQDNQDREPIGNWYKKQFDIAAIDSAKLIITDNWQGIKSEDGLIIYLTDKQYNNIITITYIPGQDNVLDYINIFEMMIKSLEIGN